MDNNPTSKIFRVCIISLAMLSTSGEAKTWVSEGCASEFESTENGFIYTANFESKLCQIESWPLDTTTATMSCDDGSKIFVNFPPETTQDWVEIDGRRLLPVIVGIGCE